MSSCYSSHVSKFNIILKHFCKLQACQVPGLPAAYEKVKKKQKKKKHELFVFIWLQIVEQYTDQVAWNKHLLLTYVKQDLKYS